MTISVFGPHYAAYRNLQLAVNHAERAHALLMRMIEECEDARRSHNVTEISHAEQWLRGAPLELEALVDVLVSDWRLSGVDADEVAVSIEDGVTEVVHVGLLAEFNVRQFGCCTADEEVTTAGGGVVSIEDGEDANSTETTEVHVLPISEESTLDVVITPTVDMTIEGATVDMTLDEDVPSSTPGSTFSDD